jgi:hypothetical protein
MVCRLDTLQNEYNEGVKAVARFRLAYLWMGISHCAREARSSRFELEMDNDGRKRVLLR